jgi:hypothetical protein
MLINRQWSQSLFQIDIGTPQRFPPRALQGFILPIPNVLR